MKIKDVLTLAPRCLFCEKEIVSMKLDPDKIFVCPSCGEGSLENIKTRAKALSDNLKKWEELFLLLDILEEEEDEIETGTVVVLEEGEPVRSGLLDWLED